MTHDSQKVTVYSFMTLDQGVESGEMAPFKAPRDLIVSRFGGQVLEGTGQEVDADELDPAGCLSRVPTGWGALPA